MIDFNDAVCCAVVTTAPPAPEARFDATELRCRSRASRKGRDRDCGTFLGVYPFQMVLVQILRRAPQAPDGTAYTAPCPECGLVSRWRILAPEFGR